MPSIPWTPLTLPPADCRVALVTSCGVHLATQPPFDLAGDTSFRELSSTLTPAEVRLAHAHYDHRSAEADLNVVFPLARLHELAAEGVIGDVAPRHYSFMGAVSDPTPLIRDTAPEVARRLQADAVQIVLLTPC